MSANWLHHRPDQPGQQAMPVFAGQKLGVVGGRLTNRGHKVSDLRLGTPGRNMQMASLLLELAK